MPLDELNNLPQPATDWLPLDPSLLGDARPTPPAFPLHLLPGRWRAWVDASSRLFGSADYLAHCLLGHWMAEAGRRPGANSARPAWLAGWSAAETMIGNWPKNCCAVGIAGALSPERLAAFSDSALASRFLYVWPERRVAEVSLAEADEDDEGVAELLRDIANFAGHRERPAIVPLDAAAARRLEALMLEIQQRADETEGVATEWMGRGVSTIVRLAGVVALMEWAESGEWFLPVSAAHIEAAYELWSGYYLPHALAVFDRAGAGQGDRAARRVVRWLKRVRAPQVSREEVRREALCQSVGADAAEDVLARLEAGGVLRPVAATGSTKGGPRPRR